MSCFKMGFLKMAALILALKFPDIMHSTENNYFNGVSLVLVYSGVCSTKYDNMRCLDTRPATILSYVQHLRSSLRSGQNHIMDKYQS